MGSSTRAWLYVRDGESVRVVMEDATLTVFGPGGRHEEHRHADQADAMLMHGSIERQLVADGWWLERMTTERRSGRDRRGAPRPGDRRRSLRLVH